MSILNYLKHNKRFIGLFFSVAYSLIIRILAEYGMMDVNSIAFMYVTPGVISFIPFFFQDEKFLKSTWRWITFPIVSVLLFLAIAVVERLEDLICFLIIGFPYALISVLISLVLGSWIKKNKEKLTKNSLPILLIPCMFGYVEDHTSKEVQSITIKNEIILNRSKALVFSNLLAVPRLKKETNASVLNYFGLPHPIYSTYDTVKNERLGYFENGLILNESVVKMKPNEFVLFHIDIAKSKIVNSPTLSHLLLSKNVVFNAISYRVIEIKKDQSKLILSTNFQINSNLTAYSCFWSKLVINDFEINLLKSIKKTLVSKHTI